MHANLWIALPYLFIVFGDNCFLFKDNLFYFRDNHFSFGDNFFQLRDNYFLFGENLFLSLYLEITAFHFMLCYSGVMDYNGISGWFNINVHASIVVDSGLIP